MNHIVPNVTCDYKFAEAGVYDVVESDFFDWVVEIEGGEAFIRTLAKSLMRFVWGDVGQYVLRFSTKTSSGPKPGSGWESTSYSATAILPPISAKS